MIRRKHPNYRMIYASYLVIVVFLVWLALVMAGTENCLKKASRENVTVDITFTGRCKVIDDAP